MNLHQRRSDKLSQVFIALAHPVRREILSSLIDGDASVKDLAEPFEMSFVAITKHLKILERAGLISRSKNAQFHLSHLQVEPLKEVENWMTNYRQFWDESFDKLDKHIEELNLKENENEPKKSSSK